MNNVERTVDLSFRWIELLSGNPHSFRGVIRIGRRDGSKVRATARRRHRTSCQDLRRGNRCRTDLGNGQRPSGRRRSKESFAFLRSRPLQAFHSSSRNNGMQRITWGRHEHRGGIEKGPGGKTGQESVSPVCERCGDHTGRTVEFIIYQDELEPCTN